MNYELICGDALTVLRTLPSGSVQMCCTSPPYFGLRDYGTATWEGGDAECDHLETNDTRIGVKQVSNAGTSRLGDSQVCGKCGARRIDQQIGLEQTPEQYVARLVEVFREVRRVLHPSGVLFLNIGDSYASRLRQAGDEHAGPLSKSARGVITDISRPLAPGYKEKDLYGIPWMLAFALRADGWYLRQEIIWHKLAPMPESVTDRCTKAHEQVFLLAKSERYYFDNVAIAEQGKPEGSHSRGNGFGKLIASPYGKQSTGTLETPSNGRNKRSVWTLGPESFTGQTQTSRLQRVEPYEVSDDTICKVSASCPVHAGRFDWASSESYDVRVDELFSRTGRKRARRAPKLTFGSVQTAQQRGAPTVAENSDAPRLPHSLFAIEHDMPVRRTALVPVTNSLDTASAQTLDRTDGTQEQLDSAAPILSKPSSNIGSDDSVSIEATQPASRNIHTDTVSVSSVAYVVPPECTCSFYHEITEKTSHFAVMPTKLVEPCVLAGSSARGCCSKCGAPWERVVERTREHGLSETSFPKTDGLEAQNGHKRLHQRIKAARAAGEPHDNPLGGTVTLGWAATCTCAADVVPATVLDPFFGSGTVGAVALQHHRRFVGIDLDERNIELAHRRIQQSQPVLFEVTP